MSASPGDRRPAWLLAWSTTHQGDCLSRSYDNLFDRDPNHLGFCQREWAAFQMYARNAAWCRERRTRRV